MGRQGKIASVTNLGSMVLMMIKFNEMKDGEKPLHEVAWDWRMFQSFAGAVPGVMEGEGVFAKIAWRKLEGVKVEWSDEDGVERVLPLETADGQLIEAD